MDDQDICGLSVDQHTEIIKRNLPRGRIWTRDQDSTMHAYWRSFATVVKYLEDRACALLEEFFCDTANETLETWARMYGIEPPVQLNLGDPCLKPGYTQKDVQAYYSAVLCGVVAAQGGNDCNYFTTVAQSMGWVVECEDTSATDYAICGCWEGLGETMLGPPAIFRGSSFLGWDAINPCDFGPAINHPEPELWEARASRAKASCRVPGTTLGVETIGGDCFIVGYYDYPTEAELKAEVGICGGTEEVDLDRAVDRTLILPTPPLDGTGQYAEYTGHTHTLTMRVKATESMDLQQSMSPFAENFTICGDYYCGDTCAPLNGYDEKNMRRFLGEIIPAHVQVRWETI